MKRYIFTLLASLAFCCASAQDKRPDTLWYQYDNRFVGNEVISIVGFDSITFNSIWIFRVIFIIRFWVISFYRN